MRFVRNCLGAIFASMALVAVPSQAAENNGYMVDGVSFEVGVGEHVELARVGFQWDWNKDWFRTAGGWHLNGYWDLNLGWWHGDRYDDGHGSQDLAVIGINMTIRTCEWNVFLNDRKNGNYDIARNGWLADFNDPINFLEMWTTDSGNNDCQFGR